MSERQRTELDHGNISKELSFRHELLLPGTFFLHVPVSPGDPLQSDTVFGGSVSLSVVSDSAAPRTVAPRLLCPRVLQARVLGWVAIPFSRGSSRPRDRTGASCMAGSCVTVWATGKSWWSVPVPTSGRAWDSSEWARILLSQGLCRTRGSSQMSFYGSWTFLKSYVRVWIMFILKTLEWVSDPERCLWPTQINNNA